MDDSSNVDGRIRIEIEHDRSTFARRSQYISNGAGHLWLAPFLMRIRIRQPTGRLFAYRRLHTNSGITAGRNSATTAKQCPQNRYNRFPGADSLKLPDPGERFDAKGLSRQLRQI